MEEATIYFIANGEAAADEELRELVHRLRARDFDVQVRPTWESGDGYRLAVEAIEAGADALVGCGGDGTLHEIVNAAMEADTPPIVGGLAYGTGNDFLSAIGVEKRDGPEQFEEWIDRRPTAIDVGLANDVFFLNMATAGAGAEVTAAASPQLKDKVGSLAYFVSAIPAAVDLPTYAVNIETPQWQWDGEVTFLFVGNGPQSGGGWHFCPAAKIDDGLLDLVIVPTMPLTAMAGELRAMVQARKPGDYGPIIYRQVDGVTVEFDDDVPINLDGEPQSGRRFEFGLEPRRLRFLVP
jgi:lipid kinase YegS